MATRNRTALFMRYRSEASSVQPKPFQEFDLDQGTSTSSTQAPSGAPVRTLTAGDGTQRIKTPSRLPTWMLSYDSIVKDIGQIKANLDELRRRHRQHLLPVFEDEHRDKNEQDIMELSKKTTSLLHKAETTLREIAPFGEDQQEAQRISASSQDNAVRLNVQRSLAAQIQLLSTQFRSEQKMYLKNLQGQNTTLSEDKVTLSMKNKRTLIMLEDTDIPMSESAAGSGSLTQTQSRNGGFTKQQLLQIHDAEVHLEERNKEIEQIASSIQEMAAVMKDIANLVVDQGSVLDRIDYNIECAVEKTEGAVVELNKANKKSKKRVAFWCICCLILGCTVMFILLLVKLLF